MNYYLENRRGGNRAYHVTTGTGKVQCRYGVIGNNIRLAPAIDLKGKFAEDVAKEIQSKKLSNSGGYDFVQKSPFSLDQLSPDVVSFKMDTTRFPELYLLLKQVSTWQKVDSFETLDLSGVFTLAMNREKHRLQIGRARDFTDRAIDVLTPVVSAAGNGNDVLYMHQSDSRAPYIAALAMAGFAEVLWYFPEGKDWGINGPEHVSGRASSAYQRLCSKALGMEGRERLLEVLGLVERKPRLLDHLWSAPLTTCSVPHRALLM